MMEHKLYSLNDIGRINELAEQIKGNRMEDRRDDMTREMVEMENRMRLQLSQMRGMELKIENMAREIDSQGHEIRELRHLMALLREETSGRYHDHH